MFALQLHNFAMNFKKRTLKSVLLISLGLIVASTAIAQNQGRILVRIVDTQSGEPLPGTLIKVQKTKVVTFSDRTGNFVLRGLRAGDYLLEFILATYPPHPTVVPNG